MNLFEGLENVGFGETTTVELYKTKETSSQGAAAVVKTVQAEDLLYYKEFECPACGGTFKNALVKQRMAKYLSSDTDLRMYFEPLDPMYYDIILCTNCGYAAISAMFNKLVSRQVEKIKTGISSKFKPPQYPLVLTLEQAIERYKIALLNATVKEGRDGEKAYLCLKLAWLYRAVPDVAREKLFLENALTGFERAYTAEHFPICGLDETTLTYILADMARRLGNNELALRYLGRIFGNPNVPQRIKDKATTVKELVRAAQAEQKARDLLKQQAALKAQAEAKALAQPVPIAPPTPAKKTIFGLPSIVKKK